jgi:hypothetical protein
MSGGAIRAVLSRLKANDPFSVLQNPFFLALIIEIIPQSLQQHRVVFVEESQSNQACIILIIPNHNSLDSSASRFYLHLLHILTVSGQLACGPVTELKVKAPVTVTGL